MNAFYLAWESARLKFGKIIDTKTISLHPETVIFLRKRNLIIKGDSGALSCYLLLMSVVNSKLFSNYDNIVSTGTIRKLNNNNFYIDKISNFRLKLNGLKDYFISSFGKNLFVYFEGNKLSSEFKSNKPKNFHFTKITKNFKLIL